jgi:hypothetical protein
MSHYGVAVTVQEKTYYYVLDYKSGVRDLLLNTTAPITEVVVTEEGYGQPNRTMSAEEILAIVLNHPLEALSVA